MCARLCGRGEEEGGRRVEGGEGRTSICAFGSVTARDAWRRGSALYARQREMVFGFKSLCHQPHKAFHRCQRLLCFCCFETGAKQTDLLSQHGHECYRVCVCVSLTRACACNLQVRVGEERLGD